MKTLTVSLISLTLLTNPLIAGEVYRVVGDDGQVTFTDSPPANAKAETVDLPVINIATPSTSAKKEDEDGNESTEEEIAYTSARIIQPGSNATIPPGQLEVVVQLALKPSLQSGHQVQLYLDGRKVGSPTASTTFTITNLDRGSRKVKAEILGTDKKPKAKTQTVTIHVKQHSSNNK